MYLTTAERLQVGSRTMKFGTVIWRGCTDYREGVVSFMFDSVDMEQTFDLDTAIEMPCGFCNEQPVANADRWTNPNAPEFAACPRCG